MNRREVFFIADDWGLNAEVNRAIVHSHRHGALHGASLMMGQRATAEAVHLARDNPGLHVGWHLHLCNSQPVTCAAWPWGASYTRAGWAIGLSRRAWRLMRDEVAAQWELFRATELPCAFVNSHHHLHAHPFVYAALLEVIPRAFGGWLRLGTPRFFSGTKEFCLYEIADALWMRTRRRRCPHRRSDTIWGLDRPYRMQASEVAEAAQRLPAGLHEFYFHPRALDDPDTRCLLELKTCGL